MTPQDLAKELHFWETWNKATRPKPPPRDITPEIEISEPLKKEPSK